MVQYNRSYQCVASLRNSSNFLQCISWSSRYWLSRYIFFCIIISYYILCCKYFYLFLDVLSYYPSEIFYLEINSIMWKWIKCFTNILIEFLSRLNLMISLFLLKLFFIAVMYFKWFVLNGLRSHWSIPKLKFSVFPYNLILCLMPKN